MKAPKPGFVREIQVGLFMVVTMLIIALFSFNITTVPVWSPGDDLVAFFDDSVGMFENSPVKVAGIDVGRVEKIDLVDGRAKVTMRIYNQYKIPEGSVFVPRPMGLMGDKFIDIVLPIHKKHEQYLPKKDRGEKKPKNESSFLRIINWLFPTAYAQAEADGAKVYQEGDVVKTNDQGATVDDIVRELGKVASDLGDISDKLKSAVVEGDDTTPIGRIIKNVETLTTNFNEVVVDNKKDLTLMISSFRKAAQSLEETMESINSGDLKKDIKGLFESIGKVSKTISNLEEISDKINRGDGTIGRLVNDEETVVELNRALRGINSFLYRANRMQLMVDLRPEHHKEPNLTKTFISVALLPDQDHGYIAQLISTPEGTTSTTIEEVSVGGAPATITETKTTDKDKFRFSFQFYKRIYDMSFRVGLFENKGGIGIDYWWFKDVVKTTVEFYDFGREEDNPRLKAGLSIHFLRHFYITAGGDDLMSDFTENQTFFVGGGIRFTDESIKSLLALMAF